MNDPTQDEIDRARRCSDVVNMHVLAHVPAAGGPPDWNGPTPWVAIRLGDGSSDGVLYDSKAAAIKHQLHENQCAYVSIPPDGMTVKQALVYLHYTQQMYEAGLRLADPDMQVHVPLRPETMPGVIQQIKESS
jgi:hypothetical protein